MAEEISVTPPTCAMSMDWMTLRAILEAETRQERERLIQLMCPRSWLEQYRLTYREDVKPDFELLPWKVPDAMEAWRKRNFEDRGDQRPTPLVLVGPPFAGKSTWATTFGRPAVMTGIWDDRLSLGSGVTHLVLNDMELSDVARGWCNTNTTNHQDDVSVAKAASFDIPVIWTCNDWNNVLEDEDFKRAFEESGGVVVETPTKLYTTEVEAEEAHAPEGEI